MAGGTGSGSFAGGHGRGEKENGVRLIGTTSETIKKAEDRLEFKATMEKIGEPVAAQ